MNNQEIWKDVVNYPPYEVSNLGKVRNKKTNRFLALYKQKDGYIRVSLRTNNKGKYIHAHRVVATTFVDNPDPEKNISVDHIDRNRENNCVSNLRWACPKTQARNRKKSVPLERKVGKYSNDGNTLIKEYSSIKSAVIDTLNADHRSICAVCRGKRKSHANYYWRYLDSDVYDGEEFRILKDYIDVEVSNHGRVRFGKSRITIGFLSNGYKRIHLRRNDKTHKHIYIHVLVASAFIDNPSKYPIVNHKDGNRENNHCDNLEWCTLSHNSIHACKMGLNKSLRPIEQYCKHTGELVGKYISIKDASIKTGIKYHIICRMASGKQKTSITHSYTFKYA